MAHLFTGEAMPFEDGTFDCARRLAIHLGPLVMACALGLVGCKDEPPIADAGLVAPPSSEEPAPPAAEDAGEDPGPTQGVTDGQDEDGVESADEGRLTAEGRAPKGVDVGLSRDRAAAIARRNLLNKMKELGIMPPDAQELQGAAITRFWMQGKYVYAEASAPLGGETNGLNVPADRPSNSANQGQPPDAATPEGGPRP
ncbi:MAG TPA: hypothetical protein PK668_23355 [Myxococcota bacterium]|nr:hypothetical protein [Myxococcota bacterium]HRY96513.1 hypothetical protein [Myxococcota bacterium]